MQNNEITVKEPIPSIKDIATKKKTLLATIRRLYYVERWTPQDIAAALNVDEAVVKRYIKIIQRYAKAAIKKWDEYRDEMVSFLFDLFERHNTRVNRLWNLYKLLDDKSKSKLEVLQQLREEDKYIFEVIKSMGLDKETAEKSLNSRKIVYVSFKEENNNDQNS